LQELKSNGVEVDDFLLLQAKEMPPKNRASGGELHGGTERGNSRAVVLGRMAAIWYLRVLSAHRSGAARRSGDPGERRH
jgi:hypothetical protein